MKLESSNSQIPSESLQAKEDALRLKLKIIQLELQVIEHDRRNKRLEKKRAADAVRIVALEAQIQGYPNALGVKREVPQCHVLTPDTDTVNEDDMPKSPKEPILVIDSDDEGPENDDIGAEASAVNHPGRASETPLSATPAQPNAERTSREPSSPVLPDRIPHDRDLKSVELQPEMNLDGPVPDVETKIEVDDGFTRVTLSESESDDAIAADEPTPVLRRRPDRPAVRGRKSTRRGAPPVQSTSAANIDSQGRPMILVRSSRKSSTPPAEDAYNEGEEEKEVEEDEDITLPRKRRRTGSRTPKTQGKGKAKANSPAPPSRFPATVRKTRGKSKKDDVPVYAPPRPVPTMDTVRLAAESVAKEQSEPTVFDAGCATCILRDRECGHGTPGTICAHCNKGHVSHCTHTFVVSDHARAANHLEPYTRLSNERGNELVTDLATARADYELTREQLFHASSRLAVASNRVGAWLRETVSSLGADGLPRVEELLEELRPIWAQLLLDTSTRLSVDYRSATLLSRTLAVRMSPPMKTTRPSLASFATELPVCSS